MQLIPKGETYNVIDKFQNWQYSLACHGLWSLLVVEIVLHQTLLVQLYMHLPKYHTVYFAESSEQEDVHQSLAGTRPAECETNSNMRENVELSRLIVPAPLLVESKKRMDSWINAKSSKRTYKNER